MTKENKLKAIGAGMCIPLVGMVVYIVTQPKIWIIGLLTVISAFLFSYGFKLVKGKTLAEIKDEIVEDVDSIKEHIEDIKK